MAHKKIEHPCLGCGKTLRGVSMQQQYCLDCRLRRLSLGYARRVPAKRAAPDIAQIVRLAAAEHTSYGRYVARHGL